MRASRRSTKGRARSSGWSSLATLFADLSAGAGDQDAEDRDDRDEREEHDQDLADPRTNPFPERELEQLPEQLDDLEQNLLHPWSLAKLGSTAILRLSL